MFFAASFPTSEYHGLLRHTVRLQTYSAYWPAIFQRELLRMKAGLQELPHVCEHIGSTAIPGMKAKPIIDILLGVPPAADRSPYVEALQQLSYVNHGEKGVPGRLFLSLGDPCFFHVHIVSHGESLWQGHIHFRDCLKADPVLSAQYISLKSKLALQFPEDRDSYTEGKATFIKNILDNALSELSEP